MKRFIWINTKWIMLPDSRIWPLCISSQFLESVYFLVVKIGIFDRLPVKWWSCWMICSAEPCTDWWTKLFSWSVWLALECQQIMFSCIKQKKKWILYYWRLIFWKTVVLWFLHLWRFLLLERGLFFHKTLFQHPSCSYIWFVAQIHLFSCCAVEYFFFLWHSWSRHPDWKTHYCNSLFLCLSKPSLDLLQTAQHPTRLLTMQVF